MINLEKAKAIKFLIMNQIFLIKCLSLVMFLAHMFVITNLKK